MARTSYSPSDMLNLIDDSLDLIADVPELEARNLVALDEPLPRIYMQCLKLAEAAKSQAEEPIRTLHHFACTGGTLIARCLALSPNARLLSEIDPLSEIPKPHFAPSDLILQLRNDIRPLPNSVAVEVFLSGLDALYRNSVNIGERIVLRDHTHSHFCYDRNGCGIRARDTLREIVMRRFDVRSVVTVRHPLDSYLSLQVNNWVHFRPGTLEEYCRRYIAFLDAYADVALFRYENFVDDVTGQTKAICDVLELPYIEDMVVLLPAVEISGDSGRSGDTFERRPRRPVSEEIASQIAESPAYHRLCARLDYAPSSEAK